MTDKTRAVRVLTMNTLAFTACFAVWMMNGVLVTFLVDHKVFAFDKAEIGWLIGLPVLTGSILRLPVGLLADKYGGRIVYAAVMVLTAIATWMLSYANDFWSFALASLGFGFAGTSFAVGIAYSSVWFKKEHQGTALGIFGAGNAGSALTSIFAPTLLGHLTDDGTNPEGWRQMPRIYAGLVLVTAIAFWALTHTRLAEHGAGRTLAQHLAPLKVLRVWRFGLYYFLVFGGFVALAQWLVPYYVNVYSTSLVTAGLLAAIFSLPSGVIRAFGGWASDRFGARTVLYWVLGVCALCCFMLIVPRMDITSPGEGVMAIGKGTVTEVASDHITVDGHRYALRVKDPEVAAELQAEDTLIWPVSQYWQDPLVKVGDPVVKKQLLARGITRIHFQANVWVFTVLAFLVGIAMGIGKAAVYKFIPDYFPSDVGVVGGIVGVLGGLGGFVCPIIFGYLLKGFGLWTTCWMFFCAISVVCLVWLHAVVRRMMRERVPRLAEQVEDPAEGRGPT